MHPGFVKKLSWLTPLLLILGWAGTALAETAPMRIVASVVGPRNLTYLPMDLIPAIGADTAEGVRLVLRHTDGGGLALKELNNRNSDFAVTGLPAQMYQRASGGKVVAVAAINDLPSFVLVVRKELQGAVKRPADLKGRMIGVATGTITAKTTAKQLTDLLLRTDGLPAEAVRFIPTGQDWATRENMFRSARIDAMMSEEPFASRLVESGLAYDLFNTMHPDDAAGIPGGGFLFAALATRQDLIDADPERVARMTRMLRRALEWIAAHTPEEIVQQLEIQDPEEQRLLTAALHRYPRLYSRDGSFSSRQLQETERFFRATSAGNESALALRLEAMINATWAGRRD